MVRSILITGASGGIGMATCKIFYENGWKVYGTSTTKDGVEKLEKLFPKGKFYVCDVRMEGDIGRVVRNVIEDCGRIDVLINNAGDKVRGRLETISVNEYEKVMDINVKGPFMLMKKVIPIMKKQGGGKIINIASTVGYRECKYLSPYSASKHALVGLSHSVRDELIDNEDNILVSVISPGATNTKFNLPKEGMMDPKEVADAIYFVANRGDNAICDLFIYPKMEKRKP